MKNLEKQLPYKTLEKPSPVTMAHINTQEAWKLSHFVVPPILAEPEKWVGTVSYLRILHKNQLDPGIYITFTLKRGHGQEWWL